MGPPHDTALGVTGLLNQISHELHALSEEIEQLQDAMSTLLSAAAGDPEMLRRSQSLDSVSQHVAELGNILARTAAQTSPGWCVSAPAILDRMPLAGLAGRLAGRTPEPAFSGELDLL